MAVAVQRPSGARAGRVGLYAVLIVAGTMAALPFVWMILASFKPAEEIRQLPPTFLPADPTLGNCRRSSPIQELPLLTFYRNSAFIAVANVVSTLFTSSLLGYVLAKFSFKGRGAMFWFVLATMMIPTQVTMIPGYLILVQLHLLNNLWGLVLPSFFNAFGVFVMRQFMQSISEDEIWSARVDGASEWRIYRSVVLPQLKPALATLGLLMFMFSWNAYLWPLIVLTEQDKRTLPIILTWYSSQHASQLHLVMAASVLMVIPVLLVFAASQKWIVKGLTLTGAR